MPFFPSNWQGSRNKLFDTELPLLASLALSHLRHKPSRTVAHSLCNRQGCHAKIVWRNAASGVLITISAKPLWPRKNFVSCRSPPCHQRIINSKKLVAQGSFQSRTPPTRAIDRGYLFQFSLFPLILLTFQDLLRRFQAKEHHLRAH
jgi:hypothetical protein